MGEGVGADVAYAFQGVHFDLIRSIIIMLKPKGFLAEVFVWYACL